MHPLTASLMSPPEVPGEICLIMLPVPLFELMTKAAATRGIPPVAALAEAIKLWLAQPPKE